LDATSLKKLLKALDRYSKTSAEFTIEANPESLDEDKIRLFLNSGINRLSIGVQSLDGRKLKKLGRIHSAINAREAIGMASKRGFKNISADLIFGVWGEDIKRWEKEIDEIIQLPINHISCYSLTYEKDTPLFEALRNKDIAPLEDDVVCRMYTLAIDRLAASGFKQYEVSNFAKIGYECKHNLNYWENNSYVGLGASAVSYIEGVRSKNIASVKEFLRRHDEDEGLVESSERLSPIKRAKETAAVKIRTKEGIDFNRFKEKTGFDFLELEKKAVQELLEKDLIKYRKNANIPAGICLKRKGFLFCDTVSSALL
jgi:oxygen-independent coproporphyrinogen-3 oxidase